MRTTVGIDEFAKALRSTLDAAQREMDRQQAERLSRVINVDQQGQPEFLTWECRLPSGDGGERNFELLRLPWAGLNQVETVEIAELSIECDCKIRKSSRRKDRGLALLTATPIKRQDPAKANTHHIKLSVNPQDPEVAVSIDGTTAEDFLAGQFSPEQERKERRLKKGNYLKAMITLAILCLLGALAYFALSL